MPATPQSEAIPANSAPSPAAIAVAVEHGYTVHAPNDDTQGFAFCIEGDYSTEYATEADAWAAAVADMVSMATQ